MENSASKGDQMTADLRISNARVPNSSKSERLTDEATVVETTTDEGGPNGAPDPVPNGTPDPEPDLSGDATENEEPDTFDRAYVEQLRQENGKYRQRAQRADDLAHRLHRALVEQTGKLADPTDLAFDEDHLDDADSLTTAIDDLLAAKPHLAARRVAGDIGQGASKPSDGVNLLGILRGN